MDTTRHYDVAVVGLGGMGSSAAYHLARRGANVLGIEQFGVAHDRGSSHGQSRVIRQAYYEGEAYVPLLLRAYELWDELQAESRRRVLDITGGLYMGQPDSPIIRGSLASAAAHNLPHERLTPAEVRRRYPQMRPPGHFVGVVEPLAGVLDPEGAVTAAVICARRRGADLHFEEPVLSIEPAPGGEGATIVTTRGRYTCDRVVVTAGPWAGQLLADVRLPLSVERAVMYWFLPTAHVEAFAPDRCPVYFWQTSDDVSFYGFPAMRGPAEGVKVAVHSHYRVPTTPETIDRTVHAEEVNRMRDLLREYMPALDGPHRDARTCMYTMTPDAHFVIGPHPAHPQVAFAAGFSGHGFKFCSVVGEIMADLATEGRTRHSIEMFAPGRFAAN